MTDRTVYLVRDECGTAVEYFDDIEEAAIAVACLPGTATIDEVRESEARALFWEKSDE